MPNTAEHSKSIDNYSHDERIQMHYAESACLKNLFFLIVLGT
jgi:hypothetical protein